MRLIIAGSRTFKNYLVLHLAMVTLELNPLVIISGTAIGADQLGERYAAQSGIPVERHPANWDAYGKRAGYLRNAEMAAAADTLLAFWDGKSRGTGHMIDLAKAAGLTVHVWPI